MDIEKQDKELTNVDNAYANRYRTQMMLEVLLDIRELLQPQTLSMEVSAPWRPKEGGRYWTISQGGECIRCGFIGDSFDNWHLAIGQVFRTEAEAIAYRDEVLKKV